MLIFTILFILTESSTKNQKKKKIMILWYQKNRIFKINVGLPPISVPIKLNQTLLGIYLEYFKFLYPV